MAARDRILDAAATLMRDIGIGGATTKEIARVAGCSEALLYKNFTDKTQIFLAVLDERAPRLGAVLAELPGRAGTESVVEHLRELARHAVAFYRETFPMAAGIFSDHDLLDSHRAALREHGAGPWVVNRMLEEYLRRECALGRVRPDVDVSAAASLLLGACLQCAFFWHMTGGGDPPEPDSVEALADTLCVGLDPDPGNT